MPMVKGLSSSQDFTYGSSAEPHLLYSCSSSSLACRLSELSWTHFPSAVIAFALNLGAYNAEIFRSAIQAVPEGQTEAAYMVGLSYRQTMTRIVMPQAFRIAFPPLFNSLIGLTKDTSLASSITVVELFTTAQQIAARTYEPFALYCEAAVIYLMICTVLTWVQNYFEKKLVWNAPAPVKGE